MTSSSNTVTTDHQPAIETSNRWQPVLLIRSLIEGLRLVLLLVLVGVMLLFLTTGIGQLYLDWSSLSGEETEGLIPTSDELTSAWDTYQKALMDDHIPATLWATLNGLAIATVLGVLLAALMDLLPLVRWVLYPILVITQTIPTFALAVILILIFGFGFGPKIVVVVLFCFFPITVNTLNGLQSTDPTHMKLLRAMGANRLQLWWKVRLPTAMPAFFSGLRLAATYSVVGAVIGEYVGAGNGLGKFLQRSYRTFRTDQVFLAVAVIAALSIALVLLVSLVEVLALRWRYIGSGNDVESKVRQLIQHWRERW